jgi:hypothetical protein
LALSFAGAVSGVGISSIQVSTNGGATWGAQQAYATSVPVTLGPNGTYTIEIRVTDVAGNSTTSSLSVVVDTNAPTISVSSPSQGATYNGTANITPTITASDLTTISSTTVKLDGVTFSGSSINIYTLAAGTHTLSVTAVNGLGTSSNLLVTFSIVPSLAGVEDLVKYAYSAGLISSSVENSLLGYLTNTSNTLAQDLTNFENAVAADTPSKISASEAALFTGWAKAA